LLLTLSHEQKERGSVEGLLNGGFSIKFKPFSVIGILSTAKTSTWLDQMHIQVRCLSQFRDLRSYKRVQCITTYKIRFFISLMNISNTVTYNNNYNKTRKIYQRCNYLYIFFNCLLFTLIHNFVLHAYHTFINNISLNDGNIVFEASICCNDLKFKHV